MGRKTRSKSKAGTADDVTNEKDACERAVQEFRLGNNGTAFKLIKKALKRFKNCGLIYRVQSSMFWDCHSKTIDVAKSNEYLANAIDSARKAVQNSSDSIEFPLFFADLYSKVATSVEDYDLVVRVCENALLAEHPVDPAEIGSLNVYSFPTAEERIAHVQRELRDTIQKTKKLKERRMEIEAKVAAARQKQLLGGDVSLSSSDVEKLSNMPHFTSQDGLNASADANDSTSSVEKSTTENII